MLLSPYIDRSFQASVLPASSSSRKINLALCLTAFIISYFGFIIEHLSIRLIIFTLLISAIPEEWFFRVYFQPKLIKFLYSYLPENKASISGIILTSLLFSCTHAIAQQNIHFIYLVFLPSIFYGYIYLRTNDFFLIVNLHFISNIILYTFYPYLITPFQVN